MADFPPPPPASLANPTDLDDLEDAFWADILQHLRDAERFQIAQVVDEIARTGLAGALPFCSP